MRKQNIMTTIEQLTQRKEELIREVADMMLTDNYQGYSDKAFLDATIIFMAVASEKVFNLCQNENMDLETSCNMSESFGSKLRELVKTYTNIDTYELTNVDGNRG
jgi:hypothetical protein